MNIDEFTSQTREILEQTLNRLQAATLLVAELETQVAEAGRSVQGLSQIIERFMDEQANGDPDRSSEPNGNSDQ